MENKSKRVLILGGRGFIGSHLLASLAEDNIFCVVFDMNTNPEQSTQACIHVKGQFSERSELEAVITKYCITHIVHLVSTTLPKNSNENKPYDLSSNVIQTLHLLDLCVKYNIKKILFMSSGGTVYGTPIYIPVDENHPCNPICSYGIGKLAIEKYLFLYHALHGLKYISLRAANPYGPGQNPLSEQGIIANFTHKMCTQKPLEVWGDGSTIRDYFHVRDLAKLTKSALFSTEIGIFNAGSGCGTSINSLIELLGSMIDLPFNVIYKQQRDLDVPAIVLDCSAAKNKFDWHATTKLESGIKEFLEWYRSKF